MSIIYLPPENTGLDILFQDQHVIALNKPPGLLAVPGKGEQKQDSLATRVQQFYPAALTVHRLDMATSGIMLMALDVQTHRDMSRLFQQREVYKHYVAVVDGLVQPACGEISLPIINDWPNRPRQKVDLQHGKASLTRYTVLQLDSDAQITRMQLTPVSGRTHQLRVHMQAIGHAILGDQLYASTQVQQCAERLLLHATELSFRHPASGQQITVHSPAPF